MITPMSFGYGKVSASAAACCLPSSVSDGSRMVKSCDTLCKASAWRTRWILPAMLGVFRRKENVF